MLQHVPAVNVICFSAEKGKIKLAINFYSQAAPPIREINVADHQTGPIEAEILGFI